MRARAGWSAVAVAVVALGGAPDRVSAQELPMQSYEAGAWYLASFELTLLAELPLSVALAADLDEADVFGGLLCGALMPLCLAFAPAAAGRLLLSILVGLLEIAALIVAPAVTAAVADVEDVPVDFPVVFTTGMSSLISLAFVGAGVTAPSGLGALGAVVGGALGLAGGLTYSILRVDELARDPRVGVETNFLLWTPAVLGPLSAVILAAVEAPPEVTLLVSGLVGVLSIGLSIMAIEIALSEPAAPAPGPLVGGLTVEL